MLRKVLVPTFLREKEHIIVEFLEQDGFGYQGLADDYNESLVDL